MSLQRLYSQGKPKEKLNICCAPQMLRNRHAASSNPQLVMTDEVSSRQASDPVEI